DRDRTPPRPAGRGRLFGGTGARRWSRRRPDSLPRSARRAVQGPAQSDRALPAGQTGGRSRRNAAVAIVGRGRRTPPRPQENGGVQRPRPTSIRIRELQPKQRLSDMSPERGSLTPGSVPEPPRSRAPQRSTWGQSPNPDESG